MYFGKYAAITLYRQRCSLDRFVLQQPAKAAKPMGIAWSPAYKAGKQTLFY